MKREICCLPCARAWSKIPTHLGERFRRVDGELTRSCLCDDCGRTLAASTPAAAITVWVGMPGDEAPAWESEYLVPARPRAGAPRSP